MARKCPEAMPRGVWGLWQGVPEPTRTELRTVYRDLRARYNLSTRLARRFAEQTAELWVVAGGVSEEAARVAGQRQTGRGRRAKRQLVNALAKRQGLQIDSLDKALLRLEALAGRRADHADPVSELLASMRNGHD
jgi:hypothetical protein